MAKEHAVTVSNTSATRQAATEALESVLGSRFYGKNRISAGTSRARMAINLQYEPHVRILRHGITFDCVQRFARIAEKFVVLLPNNVDHTLSV